MNLTSDHMRKNTTVHSVTMDAAEAIPLTWQTDLRESDCRLSNIASRKLGERTRSVPNFRAYGMCSRGVVKWLGEGAVQSAGSRWERWEGGIDTGC